MKYIKATCATLAYILVLLTLYYVDVRFGKVNVVFYSALACGLLAALICGALLYWPRLFAEFSRFEKVLLTLIWVLGGYAFAISVPTVIDRSLSFYILEKLDQRGGGIRQDRFSDVFVKEYVVEHRLVDVRLTEQLESGTIVLDNGCVKLTEKGRELATASRFFRRHLLPKHRLLLGQYTDDLTDPFRHSSQQVDYLCR